MRVWKVSSSARGTKELYFYVHSLDLDSVFLMASLTMSLHVVVLAVISY